MNSKTLILLASLIASDLGFSIINSDDLNRGDSFEGQHSKTDLPEHIDANSNNLETGDSYGTQQEKPNDFRSDRMNFKDGSRMEEDSEGQQKDIGLKSDLHGESDFGSKNQETNGSKSYDTGKYDQKWNEKGVYDHKLDEEGAYDQKWNEKGVYDHKLDEEGAYDQKWNEKGVYDNKLDEEEAYDRNMKKEAAYDPKYTSPWVYQRIQEPDDIHDKKETTQESEIDARSSEGSGLLI